MSMDDYGPSSEQAAREQQSMEEAAAASYAANAGSRAAQPRTSSKEQQAAKIKHYRALPVGTIEDLKCLIVEGDDPAVRDGVTHQFWDMTNAEVASVLIELTGDTEFVIACRTDGWCRLTGDGYRVHRAPVGAEYGMEDDTEIRREIRERHGGPQERYNASRFMDLPGRVPGAMPVCGQFASPPGGDEFNEHAIHRLREVYRGVFRTRESKALGEKIKEEARRLDSSPNMTWSWVILIIVLLLVVLAIVVF